jgi:hypothetical protein
VLLELCFGRLQGTSKAIGGGRLSRQAVEALLQLGDLLVGLGHASSPLRFGELQPAFPGILGAVLLGFDGADLAGHGSWFARGNKLVDSRSRALSLRDSARLHFARERFEQWFECGANVGQTFEHLCV